MLPFPRIAVGAIFCAALFCSRLVIAGEVKPISIEVEGMHCPACAKKISTKLKQVVGIADVTANVESQQIAVKPKSQSSPSPRAMWEAVEKAGYKPARIVTSKGTFTSKPKS